MNHRDENQKGRNVAFVMALITLLIMGGLLCVVLYVKLINPPHGKMTDDVRMTEKKEAIIYAALGDSTGVGEGAREGGYPSRLLKRIDEVRPGSRLTNVCVSGATTDDVLRGQIDAALASRPTLITLGIGINDVGHGMSVERFAQNYETIITRLEAARAPIVVTNIPDVSLAPVASSMPAPLEYARRITLFNERISDIAARHGLLLVDAFTSTRDVIPRSPDFFSPDGFHPSDKGYEYWAETMWPMIKKAIGE